jgi:hypothetical protein
MQYTRSLYTLYFFDGLLSVEFRQIATIDETLGNIRITIKENRKKGPQSA